MKSPSQWCELLHRCGVRVTTAATWAPFFSVVIHEATFSAGPSEIDDFLGQVLHESMLLERLEEGLNYRTPGRLMAVWPTRFASLEEERPFLSNPRGLAEKVYGGRMGNTQPGMAWTYRGSGLIQLTGADNFRAVQGATGIPVFDKPDILRTPSADCLRVAVEWWEGNIPDSILGDVRKVTRAVNGGVVGLAEREVLTATVKTALEGDKA